MKISYSWLKEYISLTETPEQVAQWLTGIGLEVESMEQREAVRGGLQGVVVGEVMECVPHPGADRLRVTRVNTGSGEWLHIVCGAPNVAVGQKVPVATVGAVLYFANGEEVKIKKSKLRGVESLGMICAEDELGLGTSHEGIMVLDASAAVGTPLREVLQLESDTVFEIGLTPNRIDAASHIGVARDLAAYLRRKVTLPSVDAFAAGADGKGVEVHVENTEACTRYTGITIKNIAVRPSPEWLQKRLLAIGLRPINNVVDVTNYVLHETGQPLHAFDVDTVEGGQVIVRTCAEGSRFVTLDGVERTLSSRDLMICSATQPMCMAGVFGGQQHGVSDSTTSVFLESACFHPVWIRKTARRHGLNTDASFRYERGADPQITPYALKRAVQLLLETAGGEVAGAMVDVYPQPVVPCRIALNYESMWRLIGEKIATETLRDILQRLDFVIESTGADGLEVSAPTYRVDVTRECDVVEEILRIYGYNRVATPAHTTLAVTHGTHPDREKVQETLSELLVANGFFETMNNSLSRAAYYTSLQTFPEARLVRILNPLSSDLNALRQTLLFGGLENVAHNINRRQTDLKLFEWGNCYAFEQSRDDGTLKAFSETAQLALFCSGFISPQHWQVPQERTTFFYLKGFVENILHRVGIDVSKLETTDAPADLYADGIQYLLRGKQLAVLGTVSPKIRRQFDLKQDVFAAEISGKGLLQAASSNRVQCAGLPRFPEVRRDLALVLDEKTTYEQLRSLAFRTEKKLLQAVNLFDVYRGDKLPPGKKQYALSFMLQDAEQTLTDRHIEQIMDSLLKAFVREFDAALR